MKRLLSNVLIAACSLIFWSCSDDSESARLVVRLTDAPAEYEALFVDIEKVLVHTSESADEEEGGWTELDMAASDEPIDILELRNGVNTLLADKEIPSGKISQIRLVLGEDNILVTGGQEYDLSTPSAQQSGLKLQVNAELTPGIVYEIMLDFDAAKSVVSTGLGKYNLKPVIRTIVEAQSGAVAGTIDPASGTYTVYAVPTEGDSFSAITDETNGQFLIQGLEPGTYTIEIRDSNDEVVKELVEQIVELGQVQELGTIDL